MEKQGSGHVVTITTTLADHAIDGVPSVLANLTKGGLNSATKSLAIEYAKRGIRVNAVSPGIIKTPMHAPETHDFLAALHPVGRMGDIADVVQAVLYLDGSGLRHRRDPARRRRPERRPLMRGMPPERGDPTMPIVNIQLTREGTAPGRDPVTAEERPGSSKVRASCCWSVLNKPLDSTFVVIEEVPLENWGWGGLPAPEFRRRRALEKK